MKRAIATFAILCLAFNAMAWGATGHRIAGWIADQYLNKKTRKEIERILGQQSLAMAGNWMDEVRSDSTYNYMDDWHWVTIKDNFTYDESEKNANGDIIKIIEEYIIALKSHRLTANEEAEHLKILIHLIADIHQPLHVGTGYDRGGNEVKVNWFGSNSNLHRVWDSEMIDDTKLSYTEFAQSLDKPDATTVKLIQKTSVRDWANESMSYREQVYNIGKGKLSYYYTYNNLHVVRKRLLQSGIRIAAVLNEIYGL